MEMYKTIPEFPDYLVSIFGRVKTKSRKLRYVHAVTQQEHFRNTEERFLKVHFNNKTGYKFYQLYKSKKMYNRPIHRLVADAFLVREPGKNCVNHIDGNKHNNVVSNLEWCTDEYNHEHATKTGLAARGSRVGGAKLDERSVAAIKYLLGIGISHPHLAKAFAVTRSTITLINTGKTWASLTASELPVNLQANNAL
jgi:hypothetical protein